MRNDSVFIITLVIDNDFSEKRLPQGYRDTRQECHELLGKHGYEKNQCFGESDIWEHEKDTSIYEWRYIEVIEIKKLDIK